MADIISILLGIISLFFSIVSFCKAKSAKNIAEDAIKQTTSLFQNRRKTDLIQQLIGASARIRDSLCSPGTRPKEKERTLQEISKEINILTDNKKRLNDKNIEFKIDFLFSLKDKPEELKNEIGSFISDLKLIKDQNDFNHSI